MLFNKSKKYDFIPELYLSDETKLEVVQDMKLVGYQILSDLNTKANTKKNSWKSLEKNVDNSAASSTGC